MPKLEWRDTFELRVPEIDGDHRAMLDLMKGVQSAMALGDRQTGEQLLDRLLVFAEGHFEREHALLVRWNCPEAEEHATYHWNLLSRAVAVRKACTEIENPKSFNECCEAMLSFLVDDVVRGDMRLKSFLEEAGLTIRVYN